MARSHKKRLEEFRSSNGRSLWPLVRHQQAGTDAGDRSSCDIDISSEPRDDTPDRKSAGWLKSVMFQRKAFRLTRQLDDLGHPDFARDVRSIGFPIWSGVLIVFPTLVEEAAKP